MDETEIAVIGAGPHGLGATERLRAAGREVCVIGEPMSFWHTMPKGLWMRSRRDGSSIGDVTGPLSMEGFTAATQAVVERHLPLDDLHRVRPLVPASTSLPTSSADRSSSSNATARGFQLTFDDGTHLRAGRVLVAAGIAEFTRRPAMLRELPTRPRLPRGRPRRLRAVPWQERRDHRGRAECVGVRGPHARGRCRRRGAGQAAAGPLAPRRRSDQVPRPLRAAVLFTHRRRPDRDLTARRDTRGLPSSPPPALRRDRRPRDPPGRGGMAQAATARGADHRRCGRHPRGPRSATSSTCSFRTAPVVAWTTCCSPPGTTSTSVATPSSIAHWPTRSDAPTAIPCSSVAWSRPSRGCTSWGLQPPVPSARSCASWPAAGSAPRRSPRPSRRRTRGDRLDVRRAMRLSRDDHHRDRPIPQVRSIERHAGSAGDRR